MPFFYPLVIVEDGGSQLYLRLVLALLMNRKLAKHHIKMVGI